MQQVNNCIINEEADINFLHERGQKNLSGWQRVNQMNVAFYSTKIVKWHDVSRTILYW